MKKIITLLLGAVLCLTTVNAETVRPSGKIETEIRNVKGFSGISVSTGISVYLTQSPSLEVKVKTDGNIMEYVETYVRNGVLHIEFRSNTRVKKNTEVAVYVTMPELNSLTASSGADIKAKGVFEGKNLKVSASSAAEIKAIVEYDRIEIACSSGADVTLKGYAGYCKSACSSGADIDLKDLECREAVASASSGADISVFATEKLDAAASSGSDIVYYGSPANLNKSASSGGSIRAGKN